MTRPPQPVGNGTSSLAAGGDDAGGDVEEAPAPEMRRQGLAGVDASAVQVAPVVGSSRARSRQAAVRSLSATSGYSGEACGTILSVLAAHKPKFAW